MISNAICRSKTQTSRVRSVSPLTRHGSASVLKAFTFVIHLVPMTKAEVLTTSVAG